MSYSYPQKPEVVPGIHPDAQIHPTALIEEGATLGARVRVGPYCHIGPNVVLEEDVRLISHVSLAGDISIGARTVIYPFASLGHPPQDLKYKGEPSKTVIGHDVTIREYVTIQRGTEGDKMLTQVGNHCLLMVGSHVAHDCIVGDHAILANNATLGGHVQVGNYVIIGGLSAIQQFVRIGDHAIIGGMSGVEKDVIPFAMVVGERAHLHGLNLVGLKRRGFSSNTIHELIDVYRELFEDTTDIPLLDRVTKATQEFQSNETVRSLLDFIQADSKRPLCMPKP